MKPHIFELLLLLAGVTLSSYDAAGQYSWAKDSRNPILSGGGVGTWDSDVAVPWVIFNSDSARYEMWYTGPLPRGGIGFAVSSDGISWKRDANPVLSPTSGAWDSAFAGCPSVLRENGKYKMWYTGAANGSGPTGVGAARIGIATSLDGRNWAKPPGNLVLGVGASTWEAGAVAFPAVMKIGGGYTMFYTGCIATANLCRIGRATSSDGITWQRDTLHNPVLNIGGTGAWDGNLYLPRVAELSGKYYLWYTAETVPDDNIPRIGLATSSDSGKTWVKFAQNPVLTMGNSGSWDARWVELGNVLLVGSKFHMWYDGGAPPDYLSKIGYATALVTSVAEGSGIVPRTFELSQNFPNPFNPTTIIQYALPARSHVTLSIFNTLGQIVRELVNGEMEAGVHKVKFEPSGLSSGVYFYELKAGDFVQLKKLMILK